MRINHTGGIIKTCIIFNERIIFTLPWFKKKSLLVIIYAYGLNL